MRVLQKQFDFLFIDTPAGVESGFQYASTVASRALIVTNLDISALQDADRIIGLRAGRKVFEGTPDEATPAVIRSIYEGQMDEVVDVAVAAPGEGGAGIGDGMAVPANAVGGAQ